MSLALPGLADDGWTQDDLGENVPSRPAQQSNKTAFAV
jgi:hypothetical protein